MRVDGDRVWMLEVAPRPIGGLCAKALVFEGGAPLEELIVRHALGEDVSRAYTRDEAADSWQPLLLAPSHVPEQVLIPGREHE